MRNNALAAAFAEDRQERCRPLQGRAATTARPGWRREMWKGSAC